MPDWKPELRRRLSALRLSPTREAEIVEELSQHLDDRYEELLGGGLTGEEARRAALSEVTGSGALARELARVEREAERSPVVPGAGRKTNLFADAWQDVRYAARVLLKNPGFTSVAVVALALGIGANSAIFSVVNTILLRPLPYKDPDKLVTVWEDDTKGGFPRDTPAAANYIDWRDQNQVFEGMAAIAEQTFNLTGVGEPERLEGRRVSASLFQLLGVEPQHGRAFLQQEDAPGANRVVVIGHGLWQRRFGGDPSVVGRQINLNGENHEVVGVMPRHFQFPAAEDELWTPIAFTQQEAANRGRHYLNVVARLKPGVTLEQAQAEMSAIAARLQQQHPDQNAHLGASVVPLQEHLVGKIRPALLVLLGAVGFVLLVACANVANLLLARAAVRQKEIAVRVALGASRLRLVRQFLTESVLLAALGGATGLLLAVWGTGLLKTFIPENVSQVGSITVDARVLAFTLLVSLLTGLVFGLAPAVQASKFDLNETLKEGGRDSAQGARGNRVRAALVVAEVAVSLVLLIGAGLLINSFVRLRRVDPGFKTDNLLTMSIRIQPQKYPDFQRRTAFYTELVNRVEALPGVKSAAVTSWVPLAAGQGDSMSMSFEGRPDPAPGQGKRPSVLIRSVHPHYFNTMGIPVLAGRGLDDRDRAGAPDVAVVNEAMARKHWPGEDPVGKRITTGEVTSTDPEDWVTVVGVARDVRQQELGAEPKPQMYVPFAQGWSIFPPHQLVVSTGAEPMALAGAVRGAVWSIDRDQPVADVSTMEEVLSASLARQRFSTLLLGLFAGVALLLAAVGIYGVMSYTVAQRTHEIGVRMALGAQRSDVLKLAVGQGLRLILIGVGIGLAAAFALTRVMESLLFGISATDPATFVAIPVVLVAAGLLASYVPARRATKVDPMIALRYE